MSNNVQPIIKKVKKGGHDHAHGCAWKVAYADFVTAMMAFFLLLWLLNVSSEEQKKGLADYFLPTSSQTSQQGGAGFSGGLVTDMDGPLNLPPSSLPSVIIGLPNEDIDGDGEGDGDGEDYEDNSEAGSKDPGTLGPASETAATLAQRAAEEAQFQEIEKRLEKAISEDPELAGLGANIEIDRTEEGLRIQIVDQDERSMFPRGSDAMYPQMNALLAKVAQAMRDAPNRVSISGHTDATPYRTGSSNDNWTLSSSRANAARKVLVYGGLEQQRLARVAGMADTDPHDPDEPTAASNRRISIVLLYNQGPRPELKTEAIERSLPGSKTPTQAGDLLREWRP